MIQASAPDFARLSASSTGLLLLALFLAGVFFLLRPELWRRLFLERVDPRPAAMVRIGFGLVLLLNFVLLLPDVRFLLTDEGLYLTELARHNFGNPLAFLWDAERGFERWWHLPLSMWGRFSVLHFRSDPPIVHALVGLNLAALVAMTLGVKTRWATLVSWWTVGQMYNYETAFQYGADDVLRIFLFLGIFCRWGEAYSVDDWLRRRRAAAGVAGPLTTRRLIPVWPQRLMMLQLAVGYYISGLLKTGPGWQDGSALYYALSLDMFRRLPYTEIIGFAQYVGLLPLATFIVRRWELLFPLVLLGAALNGYERARTESSWIEPPRRRRIASWCCATACVVCCTWVASAMLYFAWYPPGATTPLGIPRGFMIPAMAMSSISILVAATAGGLLLRRFGPRGYAFLRRWLLGKRLWLGVGLAMHAGIATGMNLVVFAGAMVATYPAWLNGREVDALWRLLRSRPILRLLAPRSPGGA